MKLSSSLSFLSSLSCAASANPSSKLTVSAHERSRAMAREITTIVTVAENHMTENVMPLIDDMLSSKLTELATVSSSSKVKSRQEEEAAAQKEILRHFDLRYAEYIRT